MYLGIMFSWLILLNICGFTLADLPTMNCTLGKQDFRQCLEKEAIKFVPKLLARGAPEMNIPSFDPLPIPTTELTFDGVLVKGSITLMNSVLRGLRKTQVESFTVTNYNPPQNEEYVVETLHPRLVVKGNCAGNLSIKGYQLGGTDGSFKATMKNVFVASKIKARHEIVNGSAHLHVDDFNIEVDMQKFKINYLNNMFLNNTLGKHILDFSNQLWRIFFDGAFPYIAPTIEKLIKKKINDFSEKVSIDKILIG